MDRRYEARVTPPLHRRRAPRRAALRKETAAEVLDELIALRARHDRLVAQLRQLLEEQPLQRGPEL